MTEAAAVRYWARKVGPCSVFDLDDARQEAAIAAWRGSDSTLILYRAILTAMRSLIPGFKQRTHLFSGEAPPETDGDSSAEDMARGSEMVERIARMGPTDATVCELLAAGYTQGEVGARLGVTSSRVCQRLRLIRQRLDS